VRKGKGGEMTALKSERNWRYGPLPGLVLLVCTAAPAALAQPKATMSLASPAGAVAKVPPDACKNGLCVAVLKLKKTGNNEDCVVIDKTHFSATQGKPASPPDAVEFNNKSAGTIVVTFARSDGINEPVFQDDQGRPVSDITLNAHQSTTLHVYRDASAGEVLFTFTPRWCGLPENGPGMQIYP
jgi:hypothetical protein